MSILYNKTTLFNTYIGNNQNKVFKNIIFILLIMNIFKVNIFPTQYIFLLLTNPSISIKNYLCYNINVIYYIWG